MNHSKKNESSPKQRDFRLFNITPNPVEKTFNQISILKTPGKPNINTMALMTPNLTINETS